MYRRVWNVDATQILTRRELRAVLDDLHEKSERLADARVNLMIVRLACCCGLRAGEIAGLRMDDVIVGIDRPHLRIRAGSAKGNKPRRVPLWWDRGTLADISDWLAKRQADGARPQHPFLLTLRTKKPFTRHMLRRRFRTACKALGLARTALVTLHDGRHTFISHALAGGRTLAEVRDAAGHATVTTTSAYLHVAVDDAGVVGDLFAADA